MKKIVLITAGVAIGAAIVNVLVRRRNSQKISIAENDHVPRSSHHLTNVFASAKEYASKV